MAAVSLGFVRVWSWGFCLVWVFICLVYIFLLVLYIIFFFRSAPARREPPRQPGPAAGTGERGPGPALPQHRDLERATGSRELSSAGSTGSRSRSTAKPRLAPPGPAEPRCGAGRSGPPCALASLVRHALPFSFYFFFFSLFFIFSSLSLSLHPFLFALRFLLRFPLFGGWRQTPSGGSGPTAARRHIWRPRTPPSPGNPGAPAPAVPRPPRRPRLPQPRGTPGAGLRRRGARSPRGVLRQGLSSRGCWAPGNWITS